MRASALVALPLVLVPLIAHGKTIPRLPPVTQFEGDRYSARVAQGASAQDVTRHMARSKRTHTRGRKWQRRPVPVPRPRPGVVDKIGMGSGFVREVAQVIGGRPSGCPHRFCGCALSLHIFGRIIPHLNLAANWRHKFPHAAPASGMVAVRSGHVFKLLTHVGGSTWRVWDANSGRGRIRIHDRSIAGYTIVNPHGGAS